MSENRLPEYLDHIQQAVIMNAGDEDRNNYGMAP